jgi:hypothetical protein
MADDTDLLPEYTKGQFSLSPGGRLRQCKNVRMSFTNGARLKHSMAASPSGYSTSYREVGGSFSTEIPKAGAERDYIDAVVTGKLKQGRLEIPGTTITVALVIGNVEIAAQDDDAVTMSISFIGKMVARRST